MYREISQKLIEWKNSQRRKPLMLLGVRQSGKTYELKKLGREQFENTCYINFEASSMYSAIFDFDYDIKRIIHELGLNKRTSIVPGKTLLILDEIQECPRAITSLKYFQEDMPELHVACAGSLLGVALKRENISFPVGKVNRIEMFPMNFKEFLIAMNEEKYVELFSKWDVNRPVPDIYSKPMRELLFTYYTVGGMPDAVAEFSKTKNFGNVADIQDEILMDYSDDFSKHVPSKDIEKIRMIWESIPKQLAKENNKFMFSHVKEGKRAHELESALQWLKNSGLAHMLELVTNAKIPLSFNADTTYFKVYMSDIGLLSRRMGLSYNDYLNDNSENSAIGAVTENYVMNELLNQNKKPYYWKTDNTAELDFIFEHNNSVVPLEVKAATNTRAKSFALFCKKYSPETGFKASLKNIGFHNTADTKTISIPLYLLWNLEYYL